MTDPEPESRGWAAGLRRILGRLPRPDAKTALLVAGLLGLEAVVVLFVKPENGFVCLIPINLALLAVLFGYALKRP